MDRSFKQGRQILLILTRKLGEGILIGDNIRISVLGIRGRQVRLGIDAPSNIVIHRDESYLETPEIWECCDQKLFLFVLPRSAVWRYARLYSCRHCGQSYLIARKTDHSPWVRFSLTEELGWRKLLEIWNINSVPENRGALKSVILQRSENLEYDQQQVFGIHAITETILQNEEN